MNISLTPPTRDDIPKLCKLSDGEDYRFVAPNAVSLAQAPYETGCYPFAIRDGETIIGFASLIDFREHAYLEDGEDPQAAYLWRFMIAESAQGQGAGRAALDQMIAWARARGLGAFMTSAVSENARARALYASVGMAETGKIDDGEVEYRMAL